MILNNYKYPSVFLATYQNLIPNPEISFEMSNMLGIWQLKNLENASFFGHFEIKFSKKKKHWCLFVGFLFLIQQTPLSRVQKKKLTLCLFHMNFIDMH